MSHSSTLRKSLLINAINYANNHSLAKRTYNSAIIFIEIKNNFHKNSFTVIKSNPDYEKRINKIHSFFKDRTKEMQSSTSSDALLMNIFCHPQINKWKGIKNLLGINNFTEIKFGVDPGIESGDVQKTEIDMQIENVYFEAKLTEGSFTQRDIDHIIKKYSDSINIFDIKKLMMDKKIVSNYQLIRNFIAAEKNNKRFILLVDGRRTDLIREFYRTRDALISEPLKNKLSFITWQEITDKCGLDLKSFLIEKYGL